MMIAVVFLMTALFGFILAAETYTLKRKEWIEAQWSICTIDPPRVKWKVVGLYACFLSHYKMEAASDARYLHDILRKVLQARVFLDSSSLKDLRQLIVEGLHKSDVFLLLLTRGVLTRPWCLLEVFEAISRGLPIVLVEINDGGFSFDEVKAYIADLPARMGMENPTGLDVILEELGSTPIRRLQAAVLGLLDEHHKSCAPTLVWNPSAGDHMMLAAVKDIVERMGEVAGRELTWSASRTAKSNELPWDQKVAMRCRSSEVIKDTLRSRAVLARQPSAQMNVSKRFNLKNVLNTSERSSRSERRSRGSRCKLSTRSKTLSSLCDLGVNVTTVSSSNLESGNTTNGHASSEQHETGGRESPRPASSSAHSTEGQVSPGAERVPDVAGRPRGESAPPALGPRVVPAAANRISVAAFVAFTPNNIANARVLKAELSRKLNRYVGLCDEENTFELIPQASALVVVLCDKVLITPSCIIVMYAAIEANVPIITVLLDGGGYNFADATSQLSDPELWGSRLPNSLFKQPLLEHFSGPPRQEKVELEAVQRALRATVMPIIAIPWQPQGGSKNHYDAVTTHIANSIPKHPAKPNKWAAVKGAVRAQAALQQINAAGNVQPAAAADCSATPHRKPSLKDPPRKPSLRDPPRKPSFKDVVKGVVRSQSALQHITTARKASKGEGDASSPKRADRKTD